MMIKNIKLLYFVVVLNLAFTEVADYYNNKTIEYDLSISSFNIVVPTYGEIEIEQARDIAIKKAAKKALEKGKKYFKIKAFKKVRVLLGKKIWPNSASFPNNLEEQIKEKGYDREKFIQDSEVKKSPEAIDGYLFEIELVDREQNAYKACDYVECK